tara:strand:+ start:1694 stop:1996 length:303 start_codon:yes stop_codon:yes gene_type:complete
MIIYVDIDGTICTQDDKSDSCVYDNVKPRQEQIDKINKLYNEGNTIIYWTARGTVTGVDWLDLTRKQLDSWGCKYHDLRVGTKPHYDLWVDDKSKRIEEL